MLTLVALLSLPARTSFAATHVSTHITQDTIWDAAGSPYIIDKAIQVKAGASLTLQGATVQFAGPLIGLSVYGGLECYDSLLTSVADSGPGEWYQVRYASGSLPGIIDNCEFRHGGNGSASYAYGALNVGTDVSVTILDSWFHDNQRSGVTASWATVEIARSTFTDNQIGVALMMSHLTITDSIVANNGTGLRFSTTDSYALPRSVIDNNTIVDNTGYGINFGTSRVFADGTGNVIQGNSNGSFDHQIHTFYTWPDADWRGNDFGATVQCPCPYSLGPLFYHVANDPSQCITPDEPPDEGPVVSSDLWWLVVEETVYYCRTDKLRTY